MVIFAKTRGTNSAPGSAGSRIKSATALGRAPIERHHDTRPLWAGTRVRRPNLRDRRPARVVVLLARAQQRQDGLCTPSQHWVRPLLHPHTPWWCEQQPRWLGGSGTAPLGVATYRHPTAINPAISRRIIVASLGELRPIGQAHQGRPRPSTLTDGSETTSG